MMSGADRYAASDVRENSLDARFATSSRQHCAMLGARTRASLRRDRVDRERRAIM